MKRIVLGHITLPIYFHKIQSSSRNTLHDVGRFYVISEYWFLIHMNFPDDDRNRKKEPRRKGYVNKHTVLILLYVQLIVRVIGPVNCLLHSKLRIHLQYTGCF